MNLIDYTTEKRGNSAFLAKKLNVSNVTIHEWATGKKPIPERRCFQIERETKGAVTCEELRPDVDWSGYKRIAKRKSE